MMKAGLVTLAAVMSPTFGPAIVTIFGVDVPVLALGLSCVGLLFARTLTPVPLRKLDRRQELALTILLLIVLFLIVTGQIGTGEPLGGGMATVWGIGLGFSGLMVIEFFGERVMSILRAIFGVKDSGNEPQDHL